MSKMKIILILVFVAIAGLSISVGQTISGPTTPNNGETHTYSYTDDIIAQPVWAASPGTVITTWQSGITYYASIQWTGSGSGTVSFYDNTTIMATLNVTIGGPPGTPTVYDGSRCGPGTVTLNAVTGAGGTSVRWYTAATRGTYLGEGNSYTTSSISTTTTYFASSYNATTGLSSTRVAVNANVYSVPSTFSVTGGGTMCSGGSGFTIGLSGSQTGVNYQLKLNGNDVGTTVAGNGSAISLGTQTNGGTYTVLATNSSACTATMTGSAVITVISLPTSFSLTGGGTYCSDQSGLAVGLAGSQSGVTYQLRLNGSNIGSAVSGTGSAISFGSQTSAGTYTVAATVSATSCATVFMGSVSITVNTTPNLFNVLGTGSYCAGGSGVPITLSGSQSTISYQLRRDGTINVGTPVLGTGLAMSFGNQTVPGTYTVVATAPNACTRTMSSSAVVTVNPLPTAYTVSGGGAFCSSGGSVIITLSNSQTGVNYQLKQGSSNVGSPLAGNTNNALTWSGINASGTYAILATNATTLCMQTMTGSAIVTSNTPSVGGSITSTTPTTPDHFVTGSGTITLSGHTGTVQRWEVNTGSGWTTVSPSNTTTSLSYSSVTASRSYRAVVKNGVCADAASGQITINIYANPAHAASQASISYGGSSTLTTTFNTGVRQWQKNNTDISGASGLTYNAIEPGDYRLKVTIGSAVGYSAITTIQSPIASSTQNLHSVTNILLSGVTNSTNIYTLAADKLSQTIDYQDGYGRTYQVVAVGQSPDGKDVIIPTGYSSQGLVEKSYLPYVSSIRDGQVRPNAIRGSNLLYDSSEQYKFYQTTSLIANDAYPYSVKVLASSPLATLKEQGAPGFDWQPGNGHTIKNEILVNAANQVRYWKTDGTTNSYYGANTLLQNQVTDENGNKVRTFTDKIGRTILKQVQIDETIEGVVTPWLETYYIYDEYNRIKYILPPKAMKVLGTGASLSATNATIAELIYTFLFDLKGRIIEKKVPGAALEKIVYDNLDRVVFTQNAVQADSSKWMFVKYDRYNRPAYSGYYSRAISRTALQSEMDARNYSTEAYFETEAVNATFQGYTNTVYPTTLLTVLSVNYYDHYDFDRNGTADYTYDAAHLSGQETSALTRTRGMATGSRRRVLHTNGGPTSTWLVSAVFFDKFSRPIQTISNNHLYTTMADKTTMIYDFAGKVLKSKTTHYQNATTSLYFVDRMEYDNSGRVVKVYRQINTLTEQLLAQYFYNKLGQVIDKKLHHTGGTNFLQSVDYRYNIRGWLTSINNAQLNDNNPNNDDTNDYFGMELVYNTDEVGLANTKYYNGNISAAKWKGVGTTGIADQRSYKYTYDKSDRLKNATFQAHNGTNWTKEANTLDELLTYDHNGNILSLKRYQNNRSNTGLTITSSAQLIDDLSYTYANNFNQLTKVEDAATIAGGFVNALNTATEYTYNTSGSLTKDDNKGISSTTYNMLGKPKAVTFSNGKKIEYTYDASGNKLSMRTLQGTTVLTTTNYVGGFVYEGATPVLSFFSSPEGRVVKNGSNYEYQYNITDHQGNTRVLFTSAAQTPVAVTANMEATTNSNFQNYTNRVGFNLFDKTDAGTTYTYAQKLTGASNAQVGVAKSYKVYPGDKVKIDAWAKYQNPTSTSSNISGFANALIAAFALTPGGAEGTASYALNTWGGLVAGGSGGTNGTAPKAFVNIIVFDKNYKLLDAAWDGISSTANQIGATPVVAHDFMTREYTIKEEGYVFMYVSNENATLVDVYFDDITMTYTKSNLVQYNEYYPFGMQTANSWTRENTTGNNFLNNGGTELNTTSNVYDLFYRNYDPALGRMNQVDPMATKYASLTPYNFGFNDPVYYSDPLGDDPSNEQKKIWEADRIAATQAAHDAAWNSTMNNRYMYGVVGDDNLFPKIGPGYSLSEIAWNELHTDSESVKNGSMSLYDYASKYGLKPNELQIKQIVSFIYGDSNYSYNDNLLTIYSILNASQADILDSDNIRGRSYLSIIEIDISGKQKFNNNQQWLNTMAAGLSIFGLGFEIGTHSSQKPIYWGAEDFANAAKTGKTIGLGLSIIGAALSVKEAYDKPSMGNAVDAIFGVVGVIPGAGTVIGGVYFGADLLTLGLTGKDISSHIDSYIWMTMPNGTFVPIAKIPSK